MAFLFPTIPRLRPRHVATTDQSKLNITICDAFRGKKFKSSSRNLVLCESVSEGQRYAHRPQHNTARHSGTQHSTTQHGTARQNATQHRTAKRYTEQRGTMLHSTALRSTARQNST